MNFGITIGLHIFAAPRKIVIIFCERYFARGGGRVIRLCLLEEKPMQAFVASAFLQSVSTVSALGLLNF
jgi:hypothetical protein